MPTNVMLHSLPLGKSEIPSSQWEYTFFTARKVGTGDFPLGNSGLLFILLFCLHRLFIKTTRRNTPNYWTPKYEIQNILVQERSAGGHYHIGILSLFKTNLSRMQIWEYMRDFTEWIPPLIIFIVYILTKMSSHS